MLDRFTIVVDEWTCIFTDVRMKGSTVINFLHTLNSLPNQIVNISATPLNMVYLDLMEEFRGMEYVTLQWDPSMKEDIDVVPKKYSVRHWFDYPRLPALWILQNS